MIARLLPGQRLLVIFLILLLPLMLVGRAYITQVPRTQIQFHEQERMGIQYIRPVTALLLQITKARTGSGGDVDSAVIAVDEADKRHGEALQTSRQWAMWKVLLETVRIGGPPTSDQYTQLTQALTELMIHVANTSNLILDPDLDSYYLMDLSVVRQPMLLDQVGQAISLATDRHLETVNHDQLVVARSNISRTADAIASDLTTSFESTHDPRIKAAATKPAAAFADTLDQTLRVLATLPPGGRAAVDVSALLTSASRLNAIASQRLDDLIVGRIATLQGGLGTTTQVLALLSALLILLAIGLNRSVQMVRQQTDELRQQALHDALTGLANRAAFDATLPRMLKGRRDGERGPALFLLDIDRFKGVNDQYGHHIGDHLLRLTAQRLTALCA